MKNEFIFAAFAALLTVGCSNSTENRKETITDSFPQEIRAKDHIDTIFAMADAFAMQESRMAEDAVSPCGKYVGCLQISEIMVREANRVLGEELYTYDDRYDAGYSYGMFKAVMEYHNPTLNIDKAVDIWNEKASKSYRENVSNYYTTILKTW